MKIIKQAKLLFTGIPIVVGSIVFAMLGNGYALNVVGGTTPEAHYIEADGAENVGRPVSQLPGISDLRICDSVSYMQARYRALFLQQLAQGVRLSALSDQFSVSQSESKSEHYQYIYCLKGRTPARFSFSDTVHQINKHFLVLAEPFAVDSVICCTDSIDFKLWFFAKEKRLRRVSYLTDFELFHISNGADTTVQLTFRQYISGRATEVVSSFNKNVLSLNRQGVDIEIGTIQSGSDHIKAYPLRNGIWAAILNAVSETVAVAVAESPVISKNLTESYTTRFNTLNREVTDIGITVACHGWKIGHDSLFIDLRCKIF